MFYCHAGCPDEAAEGSLGDVLEAMIGSGWEVIGGCLLVVREIDFIHTLGGSNVIVAEGT